MNVFGEAFGTVFGEVFGAEAAAAVLAASNPGGGAAGGRIEYFDIEKYRAKPRRQADRKPEDGRRTESRNDEEELVLLLPALLCVIDNDS